MATRAIESRKETDPMREVWKESVFKNRVLNRFFKKNVLYTEAHAAEHWYRINGRPKTDKKLYTEIVQMYFEEVSKNIIQKNYPYLWNRIGEFFIAKFNGSPIINIEKTKEHKKIVSYVNLHTSGWVYYFYWNRKRCMFHNRDCYEFKACDGKDLICGKRGLKKWIRKLHEDNKLTDYNAFVRNDAMVWKRRKKREEAAEKRRIEKEDLVKSILEQ